MTRGLKASLNVTAERSEGKLERNGERSENKERARKRAIQKSLVDERYKKQRSERSELGSERYKKPRATAQEISKIVGVSPAELARLKKRL